MTEHGGHDVAPGPIRALAVLADPGGRERLQLVQRRRHCLFVRLDDPPCHPLQGRDGNGFGRGEGEIVNARQLALWCGSPSGPMLMRVVFWRTVNRSPVCG